MKVAAIQHDIVWESPKENFARLAPMIERAAGDGARLVALTETYATGFSMHTDRIAESPDGPSASFLHEQATTHGVWVCGSYPERPDGAERPFNQLVLAAPDGETFRYPKIHLFSYGREDEHYAPGAKPMTVDVEGVRLSCFVCYDLRFASDFWALAEATDCYLVVANWPAPRRNHWRVLLQARAIENLAYVVGVNRVGGGGKRECAGDSMIIAPFGEVLADAGREETIISADVDPQRVRDVRAEWPCLRDR